MQNLSKEAFWNPAKELYPDAVERFCKWIDEYKEIVGWNNLFGEKVKFHNLPYEFQMGVMNRFFIEQFASKEEYAIPDRAIEYHQEMGDALEELQRRITNQQ